jgi:hypothetical protein
MRDLPEPSRGSASGLTPEGSAEEDRARRVALIAAIVFIPLFVIASLLQLRPFIWDTVDPGRSLVHFQEVKNPMQLGAWSRISLLVPVVFLAAAFRTLAGQRDVVRVSAGSLLMVASGILGAVSGVAQSVVGVFAEDYLPADVGARAHALAADAMFWLHDNLATASLIALSVAAVTLAGQMRKAGFPWWALWAGRLALPFTAAMSLLFTLKSSRRGSLLYLVPWGGAVLLLSLWILGVVVACRRPRGVAVRAA